MITLIHVVPGSYMSVSTICEFCHGRGTDPLDMSPCDNCYGTGSEPFFVTPDDHQDGPCRCDHFHPFCLRLP